MARDFTGKVAIVTGGASGIGAAVCRQLAQWREKGLPLVPVAINVSAKQLRDESLGDIVRASLQRHRLTPDLLEIEVTYPDEAAERAMLLATTGAREAKPIQAMTGAELIAAQALIRRIPVGEQVLDAILRLVRSARPETTSLETVRQNLSASRTRSSVSPAMRAWATALSTIPRDSNQRPARRCRSSTRSRYFWRRRWRSRSAKR